MSDHPTAIGLNPRLTYSTRFTYVDPDRLKADLEALINQGYRLLQLCFYGSEQAPMLMAVYDHDLRKRAKRVSIKIFPLASAAHEDLSEQLGHDSACRTRIAMFPCGTKMLKVLINRIRDGSADDFLD